LFNKKVLGSIFVLGVAMQLLTITVLSSNVIRTSTAKLFVDPPFLNFQTLVPGKRFSTNLMVANVTHLKSFALKLSYNTAMLDVVAFSFLPEENLPIGNVAVNDTAGVLQMSVTYDGDAITTETPVALANITFKMMKGGQSPLHLYDTTLSDSFGNPIPHETADGLVLILRRDVGIVQVTTSTNETYIGHVVNVTVIAKNLGDVTENFTVSAYHNDAVFQTFDVVNLASRENITVVFRWNTGDVVAGRSYSIKSSASFVPYEANTTNNVLLDDMVKIKIIGDVNNDNKVDLNDLVAWDAAFGSGPRDPNWNPQADINSDGVVDNDDGILIIQNYHNTA
jgi:hypothetical protein